MRTSTRSTKDRILAVAKKQFERQGIEGLSLRQVAKALDITPMALYRHYADKNDLIDALSEDALDDWYRRVAAIQVDSPVDWIVQMTEAFLRFGLEVPRRFEAAFLLAAPHARQFPDDIAAGRSPALSLIMKQIERAQREGTIVGLPAHEIAMTIWALGQGLISLYRANRIDHDETVFRDFYRSAMQRCLASFSLKDSRA